MEKHEELWLQAIQESVDCCHQQFEVMKKKCSAVVAINLLLLDDEIDCEQLLEMLQTDVLKYNIIEDCLPAYIQALLKAGIHRSELCHPQITGSRLILVYRLIQNAEWLRTAAGYPK